jgi:hypothetical protein
LENVSLSTGLIAFKSLTIRGRTICSEVFTEVNSIVWGYLYNPSLLVLILYTLNKILNVLFDLPSWLGEIAQYTT